MKKISIVTAIHNQLAYNQLFYESLIENSYYPLQLIIIDNSSTDGSKEFFKNKKNVKVIETGENICYSCAQNLGLKYVKTPYVAFLNNDIYLSKHWDKKLVAYMEDYNFDIISPSGIEAMETDKRTKQYMRKWRRVNSFQRLLNFFDISLNIKILKFLIKQMYGDWEKFISKREQKFSHFLYSGINGNSVVVRRDVFQKIGYWDKRITSPDFGLKLQSTKRQIERKDVRAPMIAGDVFFHHFIRATARVKNRIPYSCKHKRDDIKKVYPIKDIEAYSSAPKISLIISVYEHSDFLDKIMASLLNQTFKDFEIVIADDGSGESIQKVVKKYQKKFKFPILHIWHKDKGFRKTVIVNKAVWSSRGNYLVFIDGDCILHHRFIEQHWKHRRLNHYLSGRRVMLDKKITSNLKIESILNSEIEKIKFWKNNCDKQTIKHGIFIPNASLIENFFRKSYGILGCNFSLYKGKFYKVNGYNQNIIGRGMEDIELGVRLAKSGVSGRTITREALMYHQFHSFDPVPHSESAMKKYTSPKSAYTKNGIQK